MQQIKHQPSRPLRSITILGPTFRHRAVLQAIRYFVCYCLDVQSEAIKTEFLRLGYV